MITIPQLKALFVAYKQIPIEEVRKELSFENSPLFNLRGFEVDEAGWAYYKEGSTHFYGAVNIYDKTIPSRVFYEGLKDVHGVKSVEVEDHQGLAEFPIDKRPGKRGSYVYTFTNTPEAINLTGKKYTKHRVAMKYLDDPEIEVLYYTRDQGLTSGTLLRIIDLNDIWKKGQKEAGHRVSYDINRCPKNIYNCGHLTDFLVTLVMYKGAILHYYASNKLHPNFVSVLECKPNMSIDKTLERKFQYMYFLQHTIHLRHWDSLKENDEPINYNMGNSGDKSYKNHLRPVFKEPLRTLKKFNIEKTIQEAKSTKLF